MRLLRLVLLVALLGVLCAVLAGCGTSTRPYACSGFSSVTGATQWLTASASSSGQAETIAATMVPGNAPYDCEPA